MLSMVIIILLFGLLLTSMPIALAMVLTGVGGLLVAGEGAMIGALGNMLYTGGNSFVLVAVPLFILMGEFVLQSGIGAKLYEAASRWLSRVPGGLSVASIIAGGIFGAMCGASAPGTATIGVIAMPEMLKRGYSRGITAGSMAATGGLAMLIPPSILFIVYGDLAEISVGALFMAGVVPGIMLIVLYSIYAIVASKYFGQGGATFDSSWADRFKSLIAVWPIIILIGAVMGTIYAGIATPTESAAIGALGAMIIGIVTKTLSWQGFKKAVRSAVTISGMIFIIIVCAKFFGYVITALRITHSVSEYVTSLPITGYGAVAIIMLILVVLGCFIDGISMTLVTTPIFLPIIMAYGFDPIWYGVMLVLNIEIAVLTPPVGLNLYVVKAIAPDYSLAEIVYGSIPFILLEIAALLIVVISPQIAIWLPGRM